MLFSASPIDGEPESERRLENTASLIAGYVALSHAGSVDTAPGRTANQHMTHKCCCNTSVSRNRVWRTCSYLGREININNVTPAGSSTVVDAHERVQRGAVSVHAAAPTAAAAAAVATAASAAYTPLDTALCVRSSGALHDALPTSGCALQQAHHSRHGVQSSRNIAQLLHRAHRVWHAAAAPAPTAAAAAPTAAPTIDAALEASSK